MLHSESPRRTATPSSTTWPGAGVLLSRSSPSASWIRGRSGAEGVHAASGTSAEEVGAGRTCGPDAGPDAGPAGRGEVSVGQDAEGAVAAGAGVASSPLDTGWPVVPSR